MVTDAYERWSITRGSKCSDLTWKLLVFWKTGRWGEVLANGGSIVLKFSSGFGSIGAQWNSAMTKNLQRSKTYTVQSLFNIQRTRQKNRTKHEGVEAVSRLNIYLGPKPLPHQVLHRCPVLSWFYPCVQRSNKNTGTVEGCEQSIETLTNYTIMMGKIIWFYQLSWQCKLATVKRFESWRFER